MIDRILYDRADTVDLHITRKRGGTSVLRADPAAIDFLARDPSNFDVVATESLTCATLAEVCREMGVAFDIVKADTQGSETHILRGRAPRCRSPWPWSCRSSPSTREGNSVSAFEIGQHLYERDFVPWQLPHINRLSRGRALHGDGFFMPDWTQPEGRALITARDLKCAAILIVFGQEDLLVHVVETYDLPNKDRITAALTRLPR